jgi:hypothetical protein
MLFILSVINFSLVSYSLWGRPVKSMGLGTKWKRMGQAFNTTIQTELLLEGCI